MSVAVFVAMSTMIKAAGPLPAGEVVFFRSFFAMLPIMAFLALRGELNGAFHTSRPFSHFARGFVGAVAMGCAFFALARLPLPEAITLNYAQPLLVVVFSTLILGETVRVYRWSAVAVGLIGVLIIAWPKLTLFGGTAPWRAGTGRRHCRALLGGGLGTGDDPDSQPCPHREDRHDRALVLVVGDRCCRCLPCRSAGPR